jgi:hypothetical protein
MNDLSVESTRAKTRCERSLLWIRTSRRSDRGYLFRFGRAEGAARVVVGGPGLDQPVFQLRGWQP